MTPKDIITANFYEYIAKVTNVFAMFLLKTSIALYLFALDFSPLYRIIIHISLALVFTFNLVVPFVILFGSCTPIALNWNRKLHGHCWPTAVNLFSGYSQSCANMVTDAIYSSSPLVYLSTVQLSRHNQWGLRIVFMFGLLATLCSIAKLTALPSLQKTTDPTWDSVNLTVWSSAEVNTGLFAACIPPLRGTFEAIVRRVRGPTSTTARSRTNPLSYELQKSERSERRKTKIENNDYGSERFILPDEDRYGSDGIMKTVNVNVRDEDGIQHYRPPYASMERDRSIVR